MHVLFNNKNQYQIFNIILKKRKITKLYTVVLVRVTGTFHKIFITRSQTKTNVFILDQGLLFKYVSTLSMAATNYIEIDTLQIEFLIINL